MGDQLNQNPEWGGALNSENFIEK